MKLSLVTICFNNLNDLTKTLDSVDSQLRKPDEHWIIDGSNNGEIRNYLTATSLPPYVEWISEPDNGISDALNKGIGLCTGDVIHLLHSGDTYFDEMVVLKVMEAFEFDPALKWSHGQYQQHVAGKDVITGSSFNPSMLFLGMRKVSHPTMFVKRSLYTEYGLFDQDKKLAMDFDFIVRIRKEKFIYLPFPICVFAPDGASNIQWKKAFDEVRDSYKKYIGPSILLQIGLLRQYFFYYLLASSFGRFLLKLRQKK